MNTDKKRSDASHLPVRARSPELDRDQTRPQPKTLPQNLCSSVFIRGSQRQPHRQYRPSRRPALGLQAAPVRRYNLLRDP